MFKYLHKHGYLNAFAAGVVFIALIISIVELQIGWCIFNAVVLFLNLYYVYSSIKKTIDEKQKVI